MLIWIALILLSVARSEGDESKAALTRVPSGSLKAIWLMPVKDKKSAGDVPIISIRSFEIMTHAVTNQQYAKFLEQQPKWRKDQIPRVYADTTYLSDFSGGEDQKSQPVVHVSWFAARSYCQSLGMRLPTLNEWEYVAAASEKVADANRDPIFLKRILEWYGEPKGQELKPVGSIYKNKYGAWDMHGLIWEWVEDFNSSFVTGESREDSSFNRDKFCGAGAMSSSDKENYAAFMRFAFRSSLKGSSTVWNLGFRCARDL